ncbi:glycosyltransferase family 2 protein [Geodermatophilus normandii]|uniref:Glycosyltransferase family 2 protein n=1 Tax=Geodermatophilus normandii TaxID=1137989 RepID=A0A6P0GF65_9ACTN|nr:glycosyltransferase family 2 protein [Geodermatophilus normandii]
MVHVTQRRRGLSASHNAGVRRARSTTVSIVDDDCVRDARWVEVAAERHADAARPLLLGGTGPRPPVRRRPDGPAGPTPLGGAGSPDRGRDALGRRHGRQLIRDEGGVPGRQRQRRAPRDGFGGARGQRPRPLPPPDAGRGRSTLRA